MLGYVLVCSLAFLDDNAPVEPSERLDRLAAAELIQEYEAAGVALEGHLESPRLLDLNAAPASNQMTRRLKIARHEIRRRGKAIVPQLAEFTQAEVNRRRQRGLNFTADALELLLDSGDPQAAWTALRIVEQGSTNASDGTNAGLRSVALVTLAKATYCGYGTLTDTSPLRREDVVAHPQLTPRGKATYVSIAKRYREWMEGEGKNPSAWLPLARQRARRLLDSDDRADVYNGAVFLLYRKWGYSPATPCRDDKPAATLARVADVVEDFLRPEFEGRYLSGARKRESDNIQNWLALLSEGGPLAEPHVETFVRVAFVKGYHDETSWFRLGRIRSRAAMKVLMEKLPDARREAEAFATDSPPLKTSAYRLDTIAAQWTRSLFRIRYEIDVIALRKFASDDERFAWWKANRDKSCQEWMRENLERLMRGADAGENFALTYAHLFVPDLPEPPRGLKGDMYLSRLRKPGAAAGEGGPAIRHLEWYRKHGDRLKYDDTCGVFRLRAASP